jgi:P-type Cu+ transporter
LTKDPGIKCFHCGDDCGNHPVIYEDKPFCCNGCKSVYEILKDNDACEYYAIEEEPGTKNLNPELGNKFAYLDHEDIKKELLDFSDSGINKITFFIPSIHCSSCIWLLENLNRLNKGVILSSVNFVKKEARITFKESEINLRQLVELMASINYEPRITLNDLQKKTEKSENRKIYYKLGVAGFAFGNIMLLSFPEYVNFNDTLDQSYRNSFAWLNLLLSLPVVFYAATDYFTSSYKSLKKKIVNIDIPIALGISVLFLRSVYEILSQTDVGYLDSLSGLVFFLLIGKWYQNKTYQALSFERNYKSYFPVAVTIIDDQGAEISLPLKELKIGQRIIIRNKEIIPADAILLKGKANIDYSFVSGESTPVSKTLKSLIYAGGRQVGEAIELMVEKEISQSYLTELWNQEIGTEKEASKLNSLIDNVSRYFTMAIILIAFISGAYWLIMDQDVAMNAFTSVLIVACPCALALTLPFAFGSTMRIFGRAGFYLKKTEIVEQLSRINTIVFDKTGTLTRNDEFDVNLNHLSANDEEKVLIKSAVRQSSHPMSIAIYKSLVINFIEEIESFTEIPAEGITAIINGKEIKIGSEKFVTGKKKNELTYSSKVYISIDSIQKGFFQINNKYRDGLEKVIKELRKHKELHLLSGDNDAERENLLPLFEDTNSMHFNQSPVDKLNYIKKLKSQGKHILMIGDGLNDAGALNESHVGISIADNIYHFSPACDAILEANKFHELSKFMAFSKTAMNIIKFSFIISFLYNIFGISFAADGLLTPIISAILMPLSSVTVVAFITLSTRTISKIKGIRT